MQTKDKKWATIATDVNTAIRAAEAGSTRQVISEVMSGNTAELVQEIVKGDTRKVVAEAVKSAKETRTAH